MTSVSGTHHAKGSQSPGVSLSTMWAKDRFAHMADFVSKARELGFTHIEANHWISPHMLGELIDTAVPISSIHSPCPMTCSSRGIPIDRLSLSSLDERERMEAVSVCKRTIDLGSSVNAKAVVLHMGEVPIDQGLEDSLRGLHARGLAQTGEYIRVKKELVRQRASRVSPHLNAAKESLQELSEYGRQHGIMLGLETRFHLYEIPNMDEMAELLDEVPSDSAGYWHDVGHAEVQQRLGFGSHEEWLSQYGHRMVGIHLHDVLGISDHYAPGKGDVNWSMVAECLPPGRTRVCEIGQWNDEEELAGVVAFLRRQGLTD